jgi:hypothetical protein
MVCIEWMKADLIGIRRAFATYRGSAGPEHRLALIPIFGDFAFQIGYGSEDNAVGIYDLLIS